MSQTKPKVISQYKFSTILQAIHHVSSNAKIVLVI